MDKKLPGQDKPEGVTTKLTDAFGSKGVAVQVTPENELPQDAEGNIADLLRVGNDSLNPHSPGMGGGARGMMFGEVPPRSNANLLGIESMEELDSLKGTLNQVLSDDQKNALGMLGELIDGKFDNEYPDVVYLTIAVPVDAGKTMGRKAMLEKLLAETPPGGISGHWNHPVQAARLTDHHVCIAIDDEGDGSLTKLLFREYPTSIGTDDAAKEQQLRYLLDTHPVRPSDSVLNANVYYSKNFSPLSLATIRAPLPISGNKFVRYGTYCERLATLETELVEIDGVKMERLLAMTLFSLAGDKSNITLYSLDDGPELFILVKVNN